MEGLVNNWGVGFHRLGLHTPHFVSDWVKIPNSRSFKPYQVYLNINLILYETFL